MYEGIKTRPALQKKIEKKFIHIQRYTEIDKQ